MHQMDPSAGDLHFSGPIRRWDEAIPLGNGFCGALIWGPSRGLRFSLDRGDLWDNTPAAHDPAYTYREMVRLARAGQEQQIRKIFDAPYNHPLPTKLPAGKLIFDFGQALPQESTLTVSSAEAHLRIGSIGLRAFVHARKHLGMVRISARSFRMRVENPAYGPPADSQEEIFSNSVDTADLSLLHYPAPETGPGWFTQKIGCGMEYGIFTACRYGEAGAELAWCIASSADGPQWKPDARAMLEEALNRGYDAELRSHTAWWQDYWQQSGLRVPDSEFLHNWYLTQYLFAACSRKGCYPMPLQGVWTADDGKLPPWKGDYHHDLNTELSYCAYLKAGHFPEGESFLDYLWRMVPCGREFARSFYHARGICMPGTMTQSGESLGGWGMYSLSPANQLWLCQSFERHWRFTGDRAFLRDRAYPYLRESAAFLLDLLEEREGQYYLPVSSSPEIHDDTLAAFLTPNSNYDLALMRWLFAALAAMSRALGDGMEGCWEAHLRKLPPLAVSRDGVLQLSPDEVLAESHRHFSHAMAIYPLRLISREGENRRIVDATVRQLEALGTDHWVGYTFCWMANLYAVQGNGAGAFRCLHDFFRGFCSPNGFHLNGDYRNLGLSRFHYRPFTLEANFFAADALQEMLLRTEENRITLFPALPASWQEAAFWELRGEMGLKISARLEKGRICFLRLLSPGAQTVLLRASPGLPELIGLPERNGWIPIPLEAGAVRLFER